MRPAPAITNLLTNCPRKPGARSPADDLILGTGLVRSRAASRCDLLRVSPVSKICSPSTLPPSTQRGYRRQLHVQDRHPSTAGARAPSLKHPRGAAAGRTEMAKVPPPRMQTLGFACAVALLRPEQRAYGTRYSQAVSHPGTDRARPCLASEIGRDRACSGWCGRERTSPSGRSPLTPW